MPRRDDSATGGDVMQEEITEFLYAPLHAWVTLLAAGWQFANMIAEPMAGTHGLYAVLLERSVGSEL